MGSIFKYSGLTTKVRAMRAKLITKEQYKRLAELSTVAELIEVIKQQGSYESLFADKDPAYIHRGEFEKLMICSKYMDFEKIYRFANAAQRPYLKLYFLKYEIDIIKKAIIHLENHEHRELYSDFDKIVGKYPDIDIAKICSATNMDEILEGLRGSIFYDTVRIVKSYMNPKDFDYEIALDLFFFSYIWKKRKRLFKGDELESISKNYGIEADTLNIMWIHRTKLYYSLPKEQIYSMIIPVYYKLKKTHIKELVEAENEDAFWKVVENTFYGKKLKREDYSKGNIGKYFEEYLSSCYHKLFRENPYSLSAITAYLKDKEAEIKKIVTVAESIRYGFAPSDILKQI